MVENEVENEVDNTIYGISIEKEVLRRNYVKLYYIRYTMYNLYELSERRPAIIIIQIVEFKVAGRLPTYALLHTYK